MTTEDDILYQLKLRDLAVRQLRDGRLPKEQFNCGKKELENLRLKYSSTLQEDGMYRNELVVGDLEFTKITKKPWNPISGNIESFYLGGYLK